MTTIQSELTVSVNQIYSDFFETFPSTDSISSIVGSVYDLHDQLASAVARSYPGVDLKALSHGLIRVNAALTAFLELPEVIDAAANGGNVSQQVAGLVGAVLGGYIGTEIGFAIGAGVAAALGAPAVLAAAVGVAAAVGLGWVLSVGLEGIFEQLLGLFNPRPTDPLVIDLDGDGVELVSRANSNAYFDLDGDGFAEQTGWVKPDDGLLAVDRNGNGSIDDISELFGSAIGQEVQGSMSPAGRLLLNRRLVQAPVDAIDYVITHELCHVAEPHHGAAFFELLDKVMPDWERRKQRLERAMA
ncbi:M48 family metallopeptidase [Phaeovulum veldkampii]|uniref:M48 metallopeptidase family protein n=1 Tax=Phaeovulum veldkampii TaxID=33049 RepID=UPI0010F0BE9F|nr:M48 family metallopeptidase [Phaeovulum veldkampii]TDQ52352.1 uncharacterized protein DUF45 [Phaeovulum veldkampii DSM 11550]